MFGHFDENNMVSSTVGKCPMVTMISDKYVNLAVNNCNKTLGLSTESSCFTDTLFKIM